MSAALRLHDSAPTLKEPQAIFLAMAYSRPGPAGVWAHIEVGGGKSLAALLLPHIRGFKKPVLITAKKLCGSMEAQYEEWKEHYPVTLPTLIPSSYLSGGKNSDTLLEDEAPDAIIIDEAHHFKNTDSRRYRKVMKYIEAHPMTPVYCLSGTLYGKDLTKASATLYLTFREGTPLPKRRADIEEWQHHMDKSTSETDDLLAAFARSTNPILPLMQKYSTDSPREAIYQRLIHTPGVYISNADALGCGLEFEFDYTKPPESIKQALDRLAGSWELPNGTMLVTGSTFHSAASTLSLGFYYDWATTPEPEFLEHRELWSKTLTNLKYQHKGYDSPGELVDALMSNRIGTQKQRDIYTKWDTEIKQLAPPRKTFWVDKDFAKGLITSYYKKYKKGIIWCKHNGVEELAKELGIQTTYTEGVNPPDKAVLKLQKYGTGFNLQHHWSNAFYLELPTHEDTWEQSLGRLHRAGQKEDTVVYTLYAGAWPMRRTYRRAIENTKKAQKSTHSEYRLLYGTKINPVKETEPKGN